jgi:ComF family protein
VASARSESPAGRFREWLAGRATGVARLALPQRCELCVADAGGKLLCANCSDSLPWLPVACPLCALPTLGAAICGACLARPPPWLLTVAALSYAFPADRLLQQLKYGGQLALADWAGETLGTKVSASLASRPSGSAPDRIVALPLAVARQRTRGFNQASEIARRVARGVALPLAAPLVRLPGGAPQAALSWTERARNVRGAFVANGNLRGARIALVDDVMTTGATLAEAARTLILAGAASVECWVVARTLRLGLA